MSIDIEKLRTDMIDECKRSFFTGGRFSGFPLLEGMEIKRATPEKVVELAEKLGIDLSYYEVEED